MSEQKHPLLSDKIFALSADALAVFSNMPTLAEQYALFTPSPVATSEERILYFDTADYQLLRTGLTVYVVQTNEQTLLTVENLAVALTGKIAKPIRQRTTVTDPIADLEIATTPKAWPKALRKAVAPVLPTHAKLQPLFLAQRERLVRAIVAPTPGGKTAPPLATFTLDRVTVWSPPEEISQSTRPADEMAATAFGQLTVAFTTNSAAEASETEQPITEQPITEQDSITDWLALQPGCQPIASEHQFLVTQTLLTTSRYAPGSATTMGLQPQMLVVDGCRLIWREQLMVLLLTEAGVRYSQNREYVHEMRVAIRRMRAAAKLYRPFLPRKSIRPYLAVLRKTGRLLGHIRNLDVTLAKARRARAQAEEAGHAPKKLLKAWRQQRQEAQQRLVDWLDSSEYRHFIMAFQDFCTAAAVGSKLHTIDTAPPTPQQIRHVIPTQILDGYAAVRCYETLFETDLPVPNATLHTLRITCKYLRYNLEFVRELLGPESEALIIHLKELQELLGDLNDAIMAQTLIAEAAQCADTAAYQEVQTTLEATLRQRVAPALRALVDQGSREQLAKALARI